MIDLKFIVRLALTILILGMGGQTAAARNLPIWPIDYLVLKSQLIVEGQVFEDQHIVVQKTLLGQATQSERISFTTPFKLPFIVDLGYGCNATTLTTSDGHRCRNLNGASAVVFLSRETPTEPWQPAGIGSGIKWIVGGRVLGYYQLENPGGYTLLHDGEYNTAESLYRTINAALEKRSKYLGVLNEPDPQNRIQGLLPFLNDSANEFYWMEAVNTLAAMGPVAGPTLRKLAMQPTNIRFRLIAVIGETKDPDSATFLAQFVEIGRVMLSDLKWVLASDWRQRIHEWQVSLCALAKINSSEARFVLREAMADWEQVEFYGQLAGACIQEGLNNYPSPE